MAVIEGEDGPPGRRLGSSGRLNRGGCVTGFDRPIIGLYSKLYDVKFGPSVRALPYCTAGAIITTITTISSFMVGRSLRAPPALFLRTYGNLVINARRRRWSSSHGSNRVRRKRTRSAARPLTSLDTRRSHTNSALIITLSLHRQFRIEPTETEIRFGLLE